MASGNSLDGKLVALMGGSGFFGTHVAQALLERGARLRIAARHPESAFSLKPLANLGQLQFARCDVTNRQQYRSARSTARMRWSIWSAAFDGDLMQLMGEAAGQMAQRGRGRPAPRPSSRSARSAPMRDKRSGICARPRRLGEKLVLEAFPKATILRPSILFGEDDDFLNMFAGLIRTFPVLPVFAPDAQLQLLLCGRSAQMRSPMRWPIRPSTAARPTSWAGRKS